MKQSIVAILDPDGAYEYFKSIINFITTSTTNITTANTAITTKG